MNRVGTRKPAFGQQLIPSVTGCILNISSRRERAIAINPVVRLGWLSLFVMSTSYHIITWHNGADTVGAPLAEIGDYLLLFLPFRLPFW